MASIEILLATTVGGIWFWSRSSAKLNLLIMQNNVTSLPLWIFDKKFYATFSILNFILLILQYGLPISLFFFLSITTSLLVLLIAFFTSVLLKVIFQLISRGNPMLNYYLGAILSLVLIFLFMTNT